jgi:hypothetical protein
MTKHACLFEAKSIQEYILRSGRLRHIIGASELIDSLTRVLLDDVLRALGLERDRDVRFSREAGGAVYLFTDSEQHRDAFRDLWSIAVRQFAPGLDFVLASGEGPTDYAAYEAANSRLHAARSRQPALLPAGSPVTRYAPRTGEPAVSHDKKLGLQDQATTRFGRPAFWRDPPAGGLTHRFAPGLSANDWPRNLDYREDDPDAEFPFLPDNRYLALLHADGNGLGQLLIELQKFVQANPDDFVDLFRDFSESVSAATLAAAQDATDAILVRARKSIDNDDPTAKPGLMPARPIVLGGDDLTLLVRADLAVPFAREFLTRFEHASRQQLDALRSRYPALEKVLPPCLTAGGGIAFVKSNHPFHLAHALAEAIAKRAKDSGKEKKAEGRIPPTLAFHRVTTACHGDYRDILKTEMATGQPGTEVQTTMVAYGLDPDGELPSLADLEALVTLLRQDEMARGPARQMLTLLGHTHADASRRYQRWREVMGERAPEQLRELRRLLQRICGSLDDELPMSRTGTPRLTPLGDVTALLAVSQGARNQTAAQGEEQ